MPEVWRIANVVPLFKMGNGDKSGYYRPVKVTLVVGKLLEKILRDSIYSHVKKHRLMRDSQHGHLQR